MTRVSDDPPPERFSDETARLLLARAASLDDTRLTLAQLREAAAEAGISSVAFDAAVAEWRRSTSAAVSRPSADLFTAALRNAASLVVGWGAVAGFATVVHLLAAPWIVQKLTDPLGVAIGAIVAARLRARPAAIVLAGLTVSQSAEFLMDLFAGAPSIHGFSAHIGLMIAGVVGVALGSRFLRPSRRTPSTSTEAHEVDDALGEKEDDPSQGPSHLTRADARHGIPRLTPLLARALA